MVARLALAWKAEARQPAASPGQAGDLLRWAAQWPDRTWAVEGAGGPGRLLAQQLLAAGELVLDVQPKLAARLRLLQAGNTGKSDPNDAASVAAVRSRTCRPVAADFGAGPVVAGTVIGDVISVARFRSRDHFAACNGTAPAEVSSGGRKACRLSLRGNRRINHAIHMAAITQLRYSRSDGRAYHEKKLRSVRDFARKEWPFGQSG